MCQPTTLGVEAGMDQYFLGLLSVLFRTTQLFQELLFKLKAQMVNKFPNKIQSIFNKFQNYFKPNHKSPVEKRQPKLYKNAPPFKVLLDLPLKKSPLLKNVNPSYVKMPPPPPHLKSYLIYL